MKTSILLSTVLWGSAQAGSVFSSVFGSGDQATSVSDEVFGEKVEAYINDHPEVVVNAILKFRQAEEQKAKARAKSAIESNMEKLFDEKSTVIGDVNAPFTVVEFMDYQCGHCKDMGPLMSELVKKHLGDVRVVIREFPIFGGASLTAAQAAIAASKQGQFEAMHEALISVKGPLSHDEIMRMAKSLGLDMDQLRVDMASPEVQKALEENFSLARGFSFEGTPAFIIGDGSNHNFSSHVGAISMNDLENALIQVMSKHAQALQEAKSQEVSESVSQETEDQEPQVAATEAATEASAE